MATQTNGNFQNFITFSRGTNATLFDSTGRLTFGPNNIATQSNNFTAWTTFSSGGASVPVVTSNFAPGPDGAPGAASRLYMDTGSTPGAISQLANPASTNIDFPAGNVISVWMRSNTGSSQTISLIASNGTGSNFTVTTAWQRFSYTASAFLPLNVAIRIRATNGTTSNIVDIQVAYAQSEVVTYQTTPSEYIPTVASPVYRPRLDYDPVSLTLRGMLIEDQRTNLLTYSQEFNNAIWAAPPATVSPNVAISPDGTQNADKLVSNNSTAVAGVQQFVTSTATPHTFSVFVKPDGANFVQLLFNAAASANFANFDIVNGLVTAGTYTNASITRVGSGWYKISITFTSATTSIGATLYLLDNGTAGRGSTFTGDGVKGAFLYGAQLEAGRFATSYIPTSANPVTRNADIASLTGANFTPWYNTEGTILAYADSSSEQGGATSYNIFSLNDGTASNYSRGYVYALNVGSNVVVGTSSIADVSVGTWTLGRQFRSAQAFRTGNTVASVSGALSTAGTPSSIPVANTMTFGSNNGAGAALNGHIKSLAFYPYRLTDAQIQALTTMPLEASMSLQFTPNSDSFVDASWGV